MHKTNSPSLKKNLLIVGAVVALILLIDQIIKIYVKTHFEPSFGDEETPLLGRWFVMQYIENQGMAFGTTFGDTKWHKLALSIFRIVAIVAICYYWYKQAKAGVKTEFLIALGLVLAGATGNLIDSMFYDYLFPINKCLPWNHLDSQSANCDAPLRHTGFLMGNVVDMFKFQANWPSWVPWLGGKEVFPAIWNFADASISIGVAMIFIRQKKYFPDKKTKKQKNEEKVNVESSEAEQIID
jgi:signal peptidase II